jgi:hypothetical protein
MKQLFFIVLFATVPTLLFAQTDFTNAGRAATDSDKTVDTASMARVYVIRSTGHVGSAVNIRLLVDDVVFCKVRNNRYAQLYVQPGTHMLNATTWDKPGTPEKFALKLPVEAGKTYYLSLIIKQKFMGIEVLVEEITYNTAGPLLQKYKLDECD